MNTSAHPSATCGNTQGSAYVHTRESIATGLALSALLGKDVSGASGVLGNLMADTFGAMHPFILILAVAAFIIFLTEFTSNTASAALLVPVFVAVSEGIGMPKEVLVMVIGIGASCAFMLPVATPPNAIVFGTGLIKQG